MDEKEKIIQKLMRFNRWLLEYVEGFDVDSKEYKAIEKIGNRFGNSFNKHMLNEGWESIEGK